MCFVALTETYEQAQEETSRKRLPVAPVEVSSSSADDSNEDTPNPPRRENATSRLKARQRAQLLDSHSSSDDAMMSTSEAARLRKENLELRKENKVLRHLNIRLQKIVTEKLFLCNSLEHREKQMNEGTVLQPVASTLEKHEQHTAPSPEGTQNELGATARCTDATFQDDAENLAPVADRDGNGAGTVCLGAAAADTRTSVLFEEIDGQVFISKDIWLTATDFNFLMAARNDSIFVRDAATKIFSTAGLIGRSVTGRPSNRTKGDPKPALDSGKLSALKDFFHHFVSASPKGQSAEQIKERSKKFGRHLAGKLADVQSV
ncbi:hypothetical protein MTO96_026680 [Rhipicephalus appendiculatus]